MRHLFFKTILFVAVITIPSLSFAQFGANDPTFNSADQGLGFGDGANDEIYIASVQDDGKILIGGDFTNYNGTSINRIARLNADGSLDDTFNPGLGFDNRVLTISILSNGKYLVGGIFTSFNGTPQNFIVRLNTDGSLDFTFMPVVNQAVTTISIQIDEKVLIGGDFTNYNGTPINRIARLNEDGSLDNTFNPGSGPNTFIKKIILQNDGKILIGGSFSNFNGISAYGVSRLNVDGSLDLSFNTELESYSFVSTISLQNDGKIICGGDFMNYEVGPLGNIVRLNTDGSTDLSFNTGTGALDPITSTSIQSDGKIIIAGFFTNFNDTLVFRIARLNIDGSLDTSFIIETGTNDLVSTSIIQTDGKIIIGGNFTRFDGFRRNYITRINVDGSLDASFNSGSGASNPVYTTVIQNDGKILIGGAFSNCNGMVRNHISRLNNDGTIDTSFDPGAGANNWINTISLQNDGKIIIGGAFTSYNGTLINRIARLNNDGSLDTSFNPELGANNTVWTSAIQNDGKILIGGLFIKFDESYVYRIARLNIDGSLDTTFNTGTGAIYDIYKIAVQNDGKILIGGDFGTFNGIDADHLVRLNIDGSIDTSFITGIGTDYEIKNIRIQEDGKILIGGDFRSYNGIGRNRIARLNLNGSLDNSFDPGLGINNEVWTILELTDGKIMVGGDFTNVDGSFLNRIVCLNEDGSIDESFDPGTGTAGNNDKAIYSMALQADGKIIIGGGFQSYNGVGRNRIARLLRYSTVGIDIKTEEKSQNIYPNPTSGIFRIETDGFDQIEILDLNGKIIKNIKESNSSLSIDLSNQKQGIYIIRVISGDEVYRNKVIIK